MCWLTQVSRASYYRHFDAEPTAEQDMELRGEIQRIAIDNPRYGYRRVTQHLRREGWWVNHKRVARLQRMDNLLAIRNRKFRLATTESKHSLRVHLNLAARLTLTGADQLWVADITYIRLRQEFVYLAVVLDAWSRKVVGWHLGRTLKTELAQKALEMALERRQPKPGLVHHSDRGIQYASDEYTALLDQHGILPSMSRGAAPWDNAHCESFIKTLKAEEIDVRQYRDLVDLRAHVGEFIEQYYNRKRLHSALGYRAPEEFEAQTEEKTRAAVMSFLRHEEIYPDALLD
jgi:transposase InsO family protein